LIDEDLIGRTELFLVLLMADELNFNKVPWVMGPLVMLRDTKAVMLFKFEAA
jgi:hypothetical protein